MDESDQTTSNPNGPSRTDNGLPVGESESNYVPSNTPRASISGLTSSMLGAIVPRKRSSVSYGFASTSNYIHRSTLTSISLETDPLTRVERGEPEGEDAIADMIFVANSSTDVLPKNCVRPTGEQADDFLQALPSKHFERLRRFIEANEPDDDESYVWIRDNTTAKVTVLSLQTVMNHIKNENASKRVRWRHMSMDRITVYRYSVPSVASTKQRVKLVLCTHRNQRYLLVVLWLTIVLLFTASIILGSLYSTDSTNNSTQHTPLNLTQYFGRY